MTGFSQKELWALETSKVILGLWALETSEVILSRQGKTKALIWLCSSAAYLCLHVSHNARNRFTHDLAHMVFTKTSFLVLFDIFVLYLLALQHLTLSMVRSPSYTVLW